MRGWTIAGGAAGAALLLAALFLLYRSAGTDGAENGAFASDCCGTVELRDGSMRLNGGPTVRYKVARDAQGPYVLPSTYVGVVPDEGFEVDGTRPAVPLRLDKLPAPGRIVLYEGPTPYVFKREAGRVPGRPD